MTSPPGGERPTPAAPARGNRFRYARFRVESQPTSPPSRPDLGYERNVGGHADDDTEGNRTTAPTTVAAPTGMRLR
jgi:hypothetical protein